MRTPFLPISAAALLCAGTAQATLILPGNTVSGFTVSGQASIYHIFGHPGDPGGDYGPDLPAVQIDFASGTGNVFNIWSTGAVSCCSNAPDISPDGAAGGMDVGGANGLSGLSGNTHIPLVGLFTAGSDPFAGAAPVGLSFDAFNPVSPAPELNQVFYIGDGHTGYGNELAPHLIFTAPQNANRLYLGVIDAWGFNGLTGWYNDNQGSFSVTVHLASSDAGTVPEPTAWAFMLLGFAATGALLRLGKAALKPV